MMPLSTQEMIKVWASEAERSFDDSLKSLHAKTAATGTRHDSSTVKAALNELDATVENFTKRCLDAIDNKGHLPWEKGSNYKFIRKSVETIIIGSRTLLIAFLFETKEVPILDAINERVENIFEKSGQQLQEHRLGLVGPRKNHLLVGAFFIFAAAIAFIADIAGLKELWEGPLTKLLSHIG